MARKNNILKVGGKNLDLENWFVYHPDGTHMFTCSGKKARWYLSRNLAEKIGEFKIKFTFEPNGKGYSEDEEFGRSIRKIRCVVTGVENNLQRHHIVPYCYRTFFPQKYKSKNHHDVVLINEKEHSKYEKKADIFKNEIADIYGIKTIDEYNKKYIKSLREISKDNSILLAKIMTIIKGRDKLPNDVILNNLKYISKSVDLSYNFMLKINYIQLLKLYNIIKSDNDKKVEFFKRRHRKYYDHGYHLVKKLDSDEKVFEFVKLWRTHFINNTNPKYMPKGWSVDFRFKTKL